MIKKIAEKAKMEDYLKLAKKQTTFKFDLNCIQIISVISLAKWENTLFGD